MTTLKILSNVLLTYSDQEYMNAVNASWLYSYPITLTIGGNKYVLGSGNSDDITLFKSGDRIYILSTNRAHGYAALDTIDMGKVAYYDGPCLQGEDMYRSELIPDNFFDLSVRKQLKLMQQYDFD